MAPALVAAIHATPRRGVLAVTGGGSALLSELLTVPGASRTVLEAHVPYAEQALREFLGGEPEQACSAPTARALAMRCLMRARVLGGDFGFAITASLATHRPKRGAHRAHVAFHDADALRTWEFGLHDGQRHARIEHASAAPIGDRCAPHGSGERAREERLLTDFALQALAFSVGAADEPCVVGELAVARPFAPVVLGERTHHAARRFEAVLPGAFNPLHDGHRAMRDDAARRLGTAVGFELCVANVDKPPLDYLELNRRRRQFRDEEVVVTSTPTFVAKAKALGSVVFVVGVDTLARVAEPRYYGGVRARDQAVADLRALGCSFLVYGRVDMHGAFRTLADLALPPALAELCTGVPESEFRSDLSSTAIRHGGAP